MVRGEAHNIVSTVMSGNMVPAQNQTTACGLDYVLMPNKCSETQAVWIRDLWHFSCLQL